MVRVRSTPESIVVMVISFLRGTGERSGLSIAQLSDMTTMVVVVVEERKKIVIYRSSQYRLDHEDP